jgi:cell division protein FtsI/penicillin-binding protein 2
MPFLDQLFLRLFKPKPTPAWKLPAAPTHWQRMHEGLGPLRRWAVPVLGVGVLVAAAWAGAWWLPQAADPMRVALQAHGALLKLQPWLSGQTLHVPAGAGIWAWQQGDVHLVALRARADGPARVINLCRRRTGAKHSPDSIYPLTVLSNLRSLAGDRRIAVTPLVVPAALASGMPLLTVVGRAPDRLEGLDLRMQLSQGAGARTGAWQVAMASPVVEGVAGTFRLGKEAWLLWGGEASSTTAVPVRHSRAIRVRWQPLEGCAAGALQWQIFDAEGLSPVIEQGPAVLWAVRLGEPVGVAGVERLTLAAGLHAVPQEKTVPVEDQGLFEAALSAGLITILPDQRLAIAPADLLRVSGADTPVAAVEADGPGMDKAALLKALYQSANGSFVRRQIQAANQARHWLAVSVHEDDAQRLAPAVQWRASARGELLAIDATGLPDVQARLFAAWPEGWGSWMRLEAPLAWTQPSATRAVEVETEAADQVITQLRIPIRPGVGASATGFGHPVRLMLLGRLTGIEGGKLLRSEAACHGAGCPMPELLQALSIEPAQGAEALVLSLQPQSRFLALRPERAQQLRVQWELDGRGHPAPVWKAGANRQQARPPAEVSITAQGGLVLFEAGKITPAAIEMGVLPVLGAGSAQPHGLVGMLERLGQHGSPTAKAEVTIDTRYQRLLHDILSCMGGSGGDWLVAESRCSTRKTAGEVLDARRQAHAVVMGADTGEILAAASSARLDGATPDRLTPGHPYAVRLMGFERFSPAVSPLKPGAWIHYGGSAQGPGSTFKVAQALALELKGMSNLAVRQTLEGLSIDALDSQARRGGYSFAAAAGCYPSPCPHKGQKPRPPRVPNFGDPAPGAAVYADEGRLGLVQALRHSINTWFAYTGEWVDQTVPMGYASAQGLGEKALEDDRPVQAVLAQLEWERPWLLDGGLLPQDYDWHSQDVLRSSASVADPFRDAHSVRQQAIGDRLQTTPLAMASVAAAVATGYVVKPRLLAKLDDRLAASARGAALVMPLQRVRAGLSAVVMSGTAASAFSAPALRDVRPLVFGKTGSASLGSHNPECKTFGLMSPAPLTCMNTAWFVGYLQPGAIPGEGRPLAFAVQISHTRMLGAGLAAPVVARWLEAVRAQATETAMGGRSADKPGA